MKPEEYFKAVEECKDEELDRKLGIENNLCLYIEEPVNEFVVNLRRLRDLFRPASVEEDEAYLAIRTKKGSLAETFRKIIEEKYNNGFNFAYIPGTVIITASGIDVVNSLVTFRSGLVKKISNAHENRAIAIALKDLTFSSLSNRDIKFYQLGSSMKPRDVGLSSN